MTKHEILTAALEHREREVLHHQINIDNYQLAMAEIDEKYADDPAMAEFRARLSELLASSLVEQRKEIILRNVIAKQLEAR